VTWGGLAIKGVIEAAACGGSRTLAWHLAGAVGKLVFFRKNRAPQNLKLWRKASISIFPTRAGANGIISLLNTPAEFCFGLMP
jgi:hypothetical protein